MESSWAGAGILPPSSWEHARHPFDRLRALSGRLFPDLSAELRERTGIDNGYCRSGGLEFADAEGTPSVEEWHGPGARVDVLDEAAARSMEPALNRGLGAARHLPEMAQIRNPRHMQALIAGCATFVGTAN